MSKRSSKSKRRSKTLPALGFAGVSLSMAGGACASTSEASANTPPTAQPHELFLGEEEVFDTSLSTFYTFDKENGGQTSLAQHLKLARGGGCGCGDGGGCGCGHGGVNYDSRLLSSWPSRSEPHLLRASETWLTHRRAADA